MTRYVIDASVALKWVIPEDGSSRAFELQGADELLAPELLPVEVANALWKRIRRDGITPLEARTGFDAFMDVPITLAGSDGLVQRALELAASTGTTVYDALYLALAVREDITLVTADARFARAVAPHYPRRATLLSDL